MQIENETFYPFIYLLIFFQIINKYISPVVLKLFTPTTTSILPNKKIFDSPSTTIMTNISTA